MEAPRISVVILNWRGWQDTLACLESLFDAETDPISIFVCDNASGDESVARIRQWASDRLPAANARRVASNRAPLRFRDLADAATTGREPVRDDGGLNVLTLIQTGANLGFAGGNNVGLRYALAEGFDYAWLLNNDTEIEPDAITWLYRRLQQDAGIGMVGSTLIYFDRRDLIQNLGGVEFITAKGRGVGIGEHRPVTDPVDAEDVEKRLGYIAGASMFISRAFLEQVGLMEESYFLYYEEIDWAARARGKFRLGYAPKSVVYHKVGASIGTNDFGDRSPLSDYYLARNRLRFCLRYSRASVPFVLFDVSRAALRWAMRGKVDRATLLGRAIIGLPYRKPA